MSSTDHRETFVIAADHPSLPGHFPGHPIVPGVVLLDRVAAAAERRYGMSVTGLVQAKFLAPLLPGEEATIELEPTGERLRFRVTRATTVLASGEARVA
jgi:3-hydroxymyristoyl/3-hydroxydecanoyl-(acyl carrier protein) dehydratase